MANRNDQVFQLSLTEIAFTIAFILLLLLGYVVFKEQSDRQAAEAALAEVQASGRTTEALQAAKATLATALKAAGAGSPDDVISKLVAADNARAERDRLRKQVEDLDARLSALTELQSELQKIAKEARPDATKEQIESAITFSNQVRKILEQDQVKPSPPSAAPEQSPPRAFKEKEDAALDQVKQAVGLARELKTRLKEQLNVDLKPEQEAQALRDAILAAEKFGQLTKNGMNPDVIKKENSDLRGQVAFLKNRLDARGGRDYPPCWADENGKVEFLFSIELRPDSIAVTPAWASRRDSAAWDLPGIKEALEGPHTYSKFVEKVLPILNWSKKQDPECRHYVQLKSSITDAVQSDRARLIVENYFYKVEVRR